MNTQNLPDTTADAPIAPADTQPMTLMQKGVEKLRQHAELKEMALGYADFITKTGACPADFRGKPNDAAAAIIRGAALGFDPDAALEAWYVVHGKTEMYARAAIAVAESIGCRVWEQEATAESVTWCGTRPGDDKVESVTWDMPRVKLAGYDKNPKYKSNPIEMLRSKCQKELARIIAPRALMGIPMQGDHEEAQATQATAERLDRNLTTKGMSKLESALQKHLPPKPTEQPEPLEAEIDDTPAVKLALKIDNATTNAELTEAANAITNALDGNYITTEEAEALRADGKAKHKALTEQ